MPHRISKREHARLTSQGRRRQIIQDKLRTLDAMHRVGASNLQIMEAMNVSEVELRSLLKKWHAINDIGEHLLHGKVKGEAEVKVG